jgi:hypothetical protein
VGVDLRSVTTPETGEICPVFSDRGHCACTGGSPRVCVMMPKRMAGRRDRILARKERWLSAALDRSGKVKTWTEATSTQVSTTPGLKTPTQGTLL